MNTRASCFGSATFVASAALTLSLATALELTPESPSPESGAKESAEATAVPPPPPAPAPAPALDNAAVIDGELVLVGEGLGFVEGPVWIPANSAASPGPGFPDGGGYFAFCSLAREGSTIYRWPAPAAEGKLAIESKPVALIKDSARIIGLALAGPGTLLACSVEQRAIIKLSFDGTTWARSQSVGTVTVERTADKKPDDQTDPNQTRPNQTGPSKTDPNQSNGDKIKNENLAVANPPRRLNATNDLVVGPGGEVWFTDPAFFTPPDQLTIGYNGVYRIDETGTTTLATRAIAVPNGVALSPDAKTLYVNDFRAGRVMALAITRVASTKPGEPAQVTLGTPALVIDLRAECARRSIKPNGNNDGLRCDDRGILYTTGPGGVWIIDPARPEGERAIARLDVAATNIALGPAMSPPTSPAQGDVRKEDVKAAKAKGRTLLITGAGGKIYRVALK